MAGHARRTQESDDQVYAAREIPGQIRLFSIPKRDSGITIAVVVAGFDESQVLEPGCGAEPMDAQNEHDDDLEPVVDEGAEIETENWEDEDLEESEPGGGVTHGVGGADDESQTPANDDEEEEQEGDSSDSI